MCKTRPVFLKEHFVGCSCPGNVPAGTLFSFRRHVVPRARSLCCRGGARQVRSRRFRRTRKQVATRGWNVPSGTSNLRQGKSFTNSGQKERSVPAGTLWKTRRFRDDARWGCSGSGLYIPLSSRDDLRTACGSHWQVESWCLWPTCDRLGTDQQGAGARVRDWD
jgi:hypothetical protein